VDRRPPRNGRAHSNEVTVDSPSESSVSGDAGTPPGGANVATIFTPDQLVAGRYLVEGLLGRGGMGEVYQALDRQLEVTVALKTVGLRHSHRRSLVERLEREVRLARRITHPNVCRVYDVAAHDPGPGTEPIPFVTMEYLPGETLADLCARRGQLAHAEVLPIVEQVCAALGAAHDAGVVHRDLKPHNVMLVATDGTDSRAVVTDFGLAGSLSTDGITATADTAGSPAYMAPEQVLGQPCGRTADIYALGVMMFEMVSGRLPFVASGGLATAALRIAEAPPSPCIFAPTLPPQWEEAILRCLRREPSERFPDAGGVIAALRDAPAPATTPTPPRVPGSWLRRARVPAAVLVFAALGLAAVMILRGNARSPASLRSVFVADRGPVRQALHVAGPGNEIIEAIAREPDGSLYVTGHASDTITIAGVQVPRPETGSKFGFVAKLDRGGRLRWRRTLAATDSVRVSTMTLDGRGGLVVAGQYAGRFTETTFPDRSRAPGDCFVLMLDAASGATRWGQACGAHMGRVRSVAVDSLGRVYVAGEFDGPATFGGRVEHGGGAEAARTSGQYPHAPFVAAYGLRGELRWVFAPDGTSSARCKAFAVVEDAIYFGGAVDGGAMIVKLDPETGAQRWVKRFGGDGQSEVVSLAVSPDRQRIAAGGTFRGHLSVGPTSSIASTEDNDGWIALFDADGGFQAATTLEGPGFESARNVAFAPDGTLLAAGRHQGELRVGSARLDTDSLREDLFILALDATAAPRHLTSWGGPGEERSRFMRIDPAGLVTVTGRFEYRLDVGAFSAAAQGASDGYMVQFDPWAVGQDGVSVTQRR
jgi:outer membrane protein assembly factor BamB